MPAIHHSTHRVSYSECTIGNHVYYARYLELLEVARGEFLRDIGHSLALLQANDTALPVIECHLRYCAPARYDDQLTLETWIAALDRVRLTFSHRVRAPDGRLLVEARTQHVCTNLRERPKRLPEDLHRALGPWLAPAEGSSPTGQPGQIT